MAVRGERPPIGLAWVITWPLGAVFAALAFLAAENLRHPWGSSGSPLPTATSSGAWNERLPARIAALDAALRSGPLRLTAPLEEERGSGALRYKYRLYEVQLAPAHRERADLTIDAARGADPGLTVTTAQDADKTEVRLGLDGLLVSTVRVLWREHPEMRPRVSVIVGPLGDDLRLARHVIETIDAPIALGIRPQRPFSRQIAQLAKMFDRAAIVQLDGGLIAAPATPGVEPLPLRDIDTVLVSVPDAVGLAWSGTDPAVPRPHRDAIAELDRRHLLFVGDRGREHDGAMPVPIALAQVSEVPVTLAQQLRAVVAEAQRRGRAVAIAPPTDAGIAALQEAVPHWRAQGIDVVPVSALLAAGEPAPPSQPATLSHR
ncbi:MAG: divergent polysaccharide deacetylase family protein [Candidatus Binatia bacterium]